MKAAIILGWFILVLGGGTLLAMIITKIGQKMFSKKDKESK